MSSGLVTPLRAVPCPPCIHQQQHGAVQSNPPRVDVRDDHREDGDGANARVSKLAIAPRAMVDQRAYHAARTDISKWYTDCMCGVGVTEMQVLAECAACTNGQHFRQQSAQHELMQVDSRVLSMS
jgi:hypothetical protein